MKIQWIWNGILNLIYDINLIKSGINIHADITVVILNYLFTK